MSTISRRRALGGAATAGIGLPLLAACSDDGSGRSSADDPPTTPPTSSEATASGKPRPTRTDESSSSKPAGDGIPTSDVPVGGGIIIADEEVVITQPARGDFRAFTAICTHAQCVVTSVSDGTINCRCHKSRYSIEDGSVVGGPAPAALAAVDLTVFRKRITVA